MKVWFLHLVLKSRNDRLGDINFVSNANESCAPYSCVQSTYIQSIRKSKITKRGKCLKWYTFSKNVEAEKSVFSTPDLGCRKMTK